MFPCLFEGTACMSSAATVVSLFLSFLCDGTSFPFTGVSEIASQRRKQERVSEWLSRDQGTRGAADLLTGF